MIAKPPQLRQGDRVGILVPASPVKEDFRSRGLAGIRALGFEPVEVPDILSAHDFLAKEPQQSFADLQDFFLRDDIGALWAARGGYGSNGLLPLLAALEIPQPRIVIGSSDVSYLLWYLLDRFNMVVFYGPMAYSSIADGRANTANLVQVLSGNYECLQIPGRVLQEGGAAAPVTGGCLSNLVSLVGSPYFPVLDGRILLLEDVGERPYRLDRMFWQLAQAGAFTNIRGLLLGRFPNCFKDPEEKTFFLRRVQGYLQDERLPVIYDLPFGHGDDIHTLPLGIEVKIDTASYTGLVIEEKGVVGSEAGVVDDMAPRRP